MNTDLFARQAWSKAEAAALKPDVAPGAMVQLAYHAMFHAVRAVLLREEGASPKKHASVIRQFGLFVKDRALEFRRAGKDLSDIQERRIKADYGETMRISAADADDAFRKAKAFLDLCASKFGFPRSELSRDG